MRNRPTQTPIIILLYSSLNRLRTFGLLEAAGEWQPDDQTYRLFIVCPISVLIFLLGFRGSHVPLSTHDLNTILFMEWHEDFRAFPSRRRVATGRPNLPAMISSQKVLGKGARSCSGPQQPSLSFVHGLKKHMAVRQNINGCSLPFGGKGNPYNC